MPHSQPWMLDQDGISVAEVLRSRFLSKGENLVRLESELAAYLNKKYALFTGNGTQAQMLILKALGVGQGDEVILPDYVCDKVWKGVAAVGATPVLCDVGAYGNMQFEDVSAKITSRTKAIILVHIFGRNAWDVRYQTLQIPVIEDVCQSFGSMDSSLRTGTYTGYVFTSFHGTKSFALGEGGMLFLNDEKAFEKLQKIRSESGYYTSGTDYTGALGLALWKRYEDGLKTRIKLAALYNEKLPQPLTETERSISGNMHFRYVLKSEKPWEPIKKAFADRGIQVRKGVDNLIHQWQKMADTGFEGALKNFQTAVSIPILPQLDSEETAHIINTVNTLYEARVL